MSKLSFTICTHNMTEGEVQDAIKSVDLFCGQEISKSKVQSQFPDRYNFYFPNQDSHQCLGWDTEFWRIDGNARSTQFHGSGNSDPDIPNNISTPARYVHEQPLLHRKTGAKITLMGTWIINRWTNHPEDPTQGKRREIALKSLRICEERVQANRKAGRAVIFAGDFNSSSWNIQFEGLDEEPKKRIDRIFIPKTGRLTNVRHGPRTGVGSDLHHQSLFAKATINYKPDKPDPKPEPEKPDPKTIEKTRTVTIMHARLDRQLSSENFLADLDYLTKRKPDVITFTGLDQRENEFYAAIRARDYMPALTPGGTKIAVRGVERISLGGQTSKLANVEDYRRFVVGARIRFYDVSLWVHCTDLPRGTDEKSRENVKEQLEILGAAVRKSAKGENFSLFSLDYATNTYPRELLRAQRLLVNWDEEHVRPTTEITMGRYQETKVKTQDKDKDAEDNKGKGTGGEKKDKKGGDEPAPEADEGVKLKGYTLHPRQNSTERFLSCTYRLDYEVLKKKKRQNPDTDQDDDFLTSGDINWGDYLDDEIYNLPYAIDTTEER